MWIGKEHGSRSSFSMLRGPLNISEQRQKHGQTRILGISLLQKKHKVKLGGFKEHCHSSLKKT